MSKTNRPSVDEVLAMTDAELDAFVTARRATTMPAPNRAQGANGSNAPRGDGQLTRDDLKRMTPAEIVEAQRAGRCNHLLGRPA